MPSPGWLRERRVSITVARSRSASPGRTGAGHFTYCSPGEAYDSEPASAASVTNRIAMPQVCQPLAISPPKRPCAAAAGSVWNHCGS